MNWYEVVSSGQYLLHNDRPGNTIIAYDTRKNELVVYAMRWGDFHELARRAAHPDLALSDLKPVVDQLVEEFSPSFKQARRMTSIEQIERLVERAPSTVQFQVTVPAHVKYLAEGKGLHDESWRAYRGREHTWTVEYYGRTVPRPGSSDTDFIRFYDRYDGTGVLYSVSFKDVTIYALPTDIDI